MKWLRLFSILSLILFSGLAEAGTEITVNPSGSSDQNVINNALSSVYQAGGGTVHLNAGVYMIDNQIKIGSNTVLTGSSDAIIKVSSSSSQWFTGQTGVIGAISEPLNNVEISGFQNDGNCENLPVSYSSSDSDPHDAERLIYLQANSGDFSNNISVHDMKLYDSYSDGVHIAFANNVNCYNNFCSNCQHDAIYYVNVLAGSISNNEIAGITDDCSRLDNCQNIKVFNNTFFSYSGSNNHGSYEHGENGIQVGNQGVSFGVGSSKPDSTEDIEVCDNTFADNGLQAVLLDTAESSNVYVHDNKFVTVAGINTSGISVNGTFPTVEQSENIFQSIFDILKVNFVDSGRTNQMADDIQYLVQPTNQGKIAGGIKIVGFKDEISIDNKTYIPDENTTLVKYEAVKAPSFDNFGTAVDSITPKVDVRINNGTANATLTVNMKWYSVSTNSITKRTVKSSHIETASFSDSCPAPAVLQRPEHITGIIHQYPTYFLVYVPSNGLVKVDYNYDSNSSERTYLEGDQATNLNGVKYTNFTTVNDWMGDIPNYGDYLYVNGTLDPQKLTVIAYTPYEHFEVKNFDYISSNTPSKYFADWFCPSIGMCILILYGLRYYYKYLF